MKKGSGAGAVFALSLFLLLSSDFPLLAAIGPGGLPQGMRSWETLPNVIRDDGQESFHVEVNTNGPVKAVTLGTPELYLVPPPSLELHDDGQFGDRKSGDFIFTSGEFRFNTKYSLPQFLYMDPNSPQGLYFTTIWGITVTELDDKKTTFLPEIQVGLLRSDIPVERSAQLSEDIVSTKYLLNLRTPSPVVQENLRFVSTTPIVDLTKPIYQVLHDDFDFFTFFSTQKMLRFPLSGGNNSIAGTHLPIKNDIEGIGYSLFDSTSSFGSAGRLKGLNFLDAFSRGINSDNATHELMHQWGCALFADSGLCEDGPHYNSKSNVGSVLGGFLWRDNGDGTFTLDCNQNGGRSAEGKGAALHLSPLERYVMGLSDGRDLSPIHIYSPASPFPLNRCGQVINDIVTTFTLEDIQKRYGIRTPLPEISQRRYRIAFAAPTQNRFLNPTELTFYSILAKHYTQPVPAGRPDPVINVNSWVPITRYFGEEMTWNSSLPGVFQGEGYFIRGDANQDDKIDLSDVVQILDYLFRGSQPSPCIKAEDANDDGEVDLSDAVFLLFYLFKQDSLPVRPPFPRPGLDPTPDGLTCDN